MVFDLILLLYPMASKTWLKNTLYFTFWDRIFARVCFYKSSFFIPSFRHQHSSSCYLVVATAKIPKIWKHTPLDVYYSSIDKSQDREINHQWIIQPKLIDCPSGTFLNFVIPANLYRKFESKTKHAGEIFSLNEFWKNKNRDANFIFWIRILLFSLNVSLLKSQQ